MIPGVNSLAETIEYVKDPDVKEELRHQHQFHIVPQLEQLNDMESLRFDLDDARSDYEEVCDQCNALENELDEYRDASKILEKIKDRLLLLNRSGKVTADMSVQHLNGVLEALGERPVRMVSDEEYNDEVNEVPF
ncbi:hypothetical protein ACTNDZ_12120 [Selenomonas montiformis]|uniref:hypothetical protein n=1 Tax=Selenomonas montiformis TaxID=2652285 RepID=UPI003F8C0179